MKFKCEIDMDNAAFAHDPHAELSKIIKQISKQVNDFECKKRTKTIWDINGNNIGSWTIKTADQEITLGCICDNRTIFFKYIQPNLYKAIDIICGDEVEGYIQFCSISCMKKHPDYKGDVEE